MRRPLLVLLALTLGSLPFVILYLMLRPPAVPVVPVDPRNPHERMVDEFRRRAAEDPETGIRRAMKGGVEDELAPDALNTLVDEMVKLDPEKAIQMYDRVQDSYRLFPEGKSAYSHVLYRALGRRQPEAAWEAWGKRRAMAAGNSILVKDLLGEIIVGRIQKDGIEAGWEAYATADPQADPRMFVQYLRAADFGIAPDEKEIAFFLSLTDAHEQDDPRYGVALTYFISLLSLNDRERVGDHLMTRPALAYYDRAFDLLGAEPHGETSDAYKEKAAQWRARIQDPETLLKNRGKADK
ncbi:MAG: hypothetical protein QM755_02255 [Luteolibacter sp.]